MANSSNESADYNTDSSKEAGLDKSFVGKFVSGLLNNTPLSKWFGKDSTSKSAVRRRSDDDDEEDDASYVFQPPVKRAKLPSKPEHNNYSANLFESPVTVHNASNNINNVSSRVFGKFPEPVPGPSGIKSRKLFDIHNTTTSTNTVSNSFDNQDIVNGDNDSDSEESTSGYSSAPRLVKEKSKQNIKTVNTESSEKNTLKSRSLFTSIYDPNHNRTLFAERSPQMNTSLSSRRPAFNASTFGSPNFVDKTLATKRILNSPFYNGHTIYGGASAYGRRLGRSAEELNNSTRVSVRIKPVNEKLTNDNTTLSKTARRILSTLEQYSTPISDAKKIPVTPKKQGILSKYIGATPYLTRDRKKPLNNELQVPSIPELLQMKQKERLQNSTESVRQIATTSKSTLNKEDYKLRTEDDNKQKHSNKMKSNVTSVRQKTQPIQLVSEVKLPKVSLPITTLPKFDFVMMSSQGPNGTNKSPNSTKTLVSTGTKPTPIVEKKEAKRNTIEDEKTNSFTFSAPLVISKDQKSILAINCFKFSEPLSKKQCLDVPDNFKSTDKNVNGGIKIKNNGENIIKPASQLATGSVMDVFRKKDENTSLLLNKDKPKSAESITWECKTCLVKNGMDKVKCSACDEPRPQTQSEKKIIGFGDQFKLTSDKWECSSCMVRNNNSDKTCVACASAKPGDNKPVSKSGFGDKFKPPVSTWECTSCLIRNKNELDKCAACSASKSDKILVTSNFGDKFKPSNDTWECSTCMIRNKNDLNKCQACETLKASPKSTSTQKVVTFGDKFKPPPETWECPTCMIRNKNELTKCSACETVKPGQKAPSNSSGVTFTFGIAPLGWGCKKCLIKNTSDAKTCAACGTLNDKELERRGFGEAFKMKEGEWECSSCLVKNKREVDTCVCCGVSKPGSTSEKLSEINKEEEKKPVISFNFGIDKSSPVQFKFGIPTTTKNEEVKENNSVTVSAPTPAPTFTFGDVAKTATVTSSSFSFGINTQEKVATVTSITSASESITSTIVSSNPLLKPSEKLPEKAVPAPVGFMFGLDNSSSQKPESRKQISEENIVTSTSKTEAPVVFSSSFEPVKPALPIATFQFKPAAINGDINKPKDLFGSKPAESGNLFSNPALTPTFKFNVKPPEDSTVTTTVAAQPQASAAGIFKFGTENSQSVVPIKKTFGETTENNVSNGFSSIAKAPAFASPQTFGTVENKSFTFGISDSTPKNTRFSFGQPEKTVTPNPVFNFGSGASSTPSAGFNFSSTNTGFNFGSAGKIESLPFNPTPTNVFGSTTTEAAKNGSFNFGTNSNNNNQKAIFSFGASQTNTPSFGAQNPSGFNFGAPVPPSVPSSGFNFAGAPPSFNFTDGSGATAPPQRKIKKAYRRTHR